MSIPEIKSLVQLESIQRSADANKRIAVLYFWGDWEASSVEGLQILESALDTFDQSAIIFGKVNTQGDDALSLTSKFAVEHVPTLVCIPVNGTKSITTVVGFNPSAMKDAILHALSAASTAAPAAAAGTAGADTSAAAAAAAAAAAPASDPAAALEARLRQLVNMQPITLFMKGVVSAPRCGFSRQAVELLKNQMKAAGEKFSIDEDRLTFGSFDILTDNEVREGLKKLFNWPTYPQLYIKGELIGGLDVMKELAEAGELVDMIGNALA